MKRVLLLLVAIVGALSVSAQEKDSMQDKATAVSVDSLAVRLDRLQHAYDFLYCDFELHKQIMDLKDLGQSLDISSNGVIIDVYNGVFNRDLYNAFLGNYDSQCALLDALKEKGEALKTAVFVKMLSSDFTEEELSVLRQGFNLIDKATDRVEKALGYYELAIKAYKEKY